MSQAMEPVRYVDLLNEKYSRAGHPPYRWTIHDESPFCSLEKPLSECRVSMLTSGGVSLSSSEPWDAYARNDFRMDTIEASAEGHDFQVHDSYYETASAERDVNCVFPIDRLRELVKEGFLGSLGRHYSGFMGRIYRRSYLHEVAAPELLQKLQEDQIDLFLLVPS